MNLSQVHSCHTEALRRALAAPRLNALFVVKGNQVHWYLLKSRKAMRGKNFGIAGSRAEAEAAIAELLGGNL